MVSDFSPFFSQTLTIIHFAGFLNLNFISASLGVSILNLNSRIYKTNKKRQKNSKITDGLRVTGLSCSGTRRNFNKSSRKELWKMSKYSSFPAMYDIFNFSSNIFEIPSSDSFLRLLLLLLALLKAFSF
jgi:hypothetical protein